MTLAAADHPELSVLIPVFNEEGSLPALFDRLTATLRAMERSYEIIFVDDGSVDGTPGLLRDFASRDPAVRIVEFNRNFGQHAAVFAGFEEARGEILITLDADLQNPPEEIPTLVARIDEGYDVVGGWRENRRDPLVRRFASFLVNRITARLVGVDFHDYGCMLRAYRREVVDSVRQCREIHSFIPALAATFARRVAEVRVRHDERAVGRSKYNFYRLIRLNFDLMTGFSMLPLQLMSFFGFAVSLVSLAFAAFLLVRRLIVGPEVEGVFTLFAILFGVVGFLFMGMGLLGEYVARIYSEVRRRPRYMIRKKIGMAEEESAGPGARVEERDARVQARNARVEARDARVEARDARVEERDARVEAQDTRVEDRDARVEKGDARVEDRDARVEEADAVQLRVDRSRVPGLGMKDRGTGPALPRGDH